MHKSLSFLALIFLLLCISLQAASAAVDPFEGRDGCFLLVRQDSGATVQELNRARCRQRLSPCSTFKIAAAAMAFDSGILDDHSTFTWDGKDYGRDVCNRNQTAQSWITDSVVWVTQRLMAQLGMEQVQRYLQDFRYGNCDMSGGIERAWLSAPAPSLRISAREQVDFLRRLWQGRLCLTTAAVQNTCRLFLVERKGGDVLYGKTGSGTMAGNRQMGWFVGHLRHRDTDYLFAFNMTDRRAGQTEAFAGAKARELAVRHLQNMGLLQN